MKNSVIENIIEVVYAFPTKNREGFTSSEIDALLQQEFPAISRTAFGEKMGVVTAMLMDGETVYFWTDVILAIRCCLENREPNSFEFD